MVGPKGREGSTPPASARYRRDAGFLLNLSTPGVVPALGEMAEWFNASVQKTAGRESGLGVRIPLSPQIFELWGCSGFDLHDAGTDLRSVW